MEGGGKERHENTSLEGECGEKKRRRRRGGEERKGDQISYCNVEISK